jgi:hypothetical protein
MAEGNGEGRVVAEAGRVVVAAAVVVGRVSADRGRCLCGLVTTMIRSSVSEKQHQHQQRPPPTKTTNKDHQQRQPPTPTTTGTTRRTASVPPPPLRRRRQYTVVRVPAILNDSLKDRTSANKLL